MASKKPSGFGTRMQLLANHARDTARKSLDKKPHFVPIDTSIFDMTFSHLGIDPELINSEVLKVVSEYNKISVSSFNRLTIDEIKHLLRVGPIAITSEKVVIGVLFSSFNNVGTRLTTKLNTSLNNLIGRTIDRGHLVSNSTIATSPLQQKLFLIQKGLNIILHSGNVQKLNSLILAELVPHYEESLSGKNSSTALKELHLDSLDLISTEGKIDRDKLKSAINQTIIKKLGSTSRSSADRTRLLKSVYIPKVLQSLEHLEAKSSYGNIIVESELIKKISTKLASIRANIIILQDSHENQVDYGSKIEGLIEKEVQKGVLTPILAQELFSPSLEQGMQDIVINTILNKNTKITSTSKRVKSTTKFKSNIKVAPTIKVAIVKPTKQVSTTNRIRTTSGAFQSVVNLQGLLASRLQEVIRKNMAPPALTYQTGRFAESVKLNSVHFDSRQNALTAFLSYMKYPYATFEPGGRQGNIDRSPAALIDRSVREIAAQLTKSRMRTIIV